MADNNGSIEPRRWAPNRIASAAVLALLVCAGVAYGIYSLTSSNGSNQSTTSGNQQLTSPSPNSRGSTKAPSSSQPSSKGSANSQPSVSSNSGSNSSTTTSGGAVSQGGQLTNTGPGDTAVIGFGIAFMVGTLGHYSWRKLRSNS